MKTFLILAMLGLSSCVARVDVAPVVEEDVPTRTEIDAKDARTQCRAMARNMVQIARCDGR